MTMGDIPTRPLSLARLRYGVNFQYGSNSRNEGPPSLTSQFTVTSGSIAATSLRRDVQVGRGLRQVRVPEHVLHVVNGREPASDTTCAIARHVRRMRPAREPGVAETEMLVLEPDPF